MSQGGIRASLSRPFLRAGKENFLSAAADVTVGGRFLPTFSQPCYCSSDHRVGDGQTLTRPVFFVYRAGTRGWGSVRLRVFQLASALKSVVANPGFVRVVTEQQMSAINPTGAHLIFTKWVLGGTNRDWIRSLRTRNNTIWSDLVDGVPNYGVEELVDAFLCSSESEFRWRREKGVTSVRALHSVDSRFLPQSFHRESFEMGYLGARNNVQLIGGVAPLSTYFTDTSISKKTALRISSSISVWSHHYSVRTSHPEGTFKPATKIFLAARFGALFIGSRDDAESRWLLGDKYPYLSKSSRPKDVICAVEHARETFLGREWETARGLIADVREEACDVFVSQQLARALEKMDGLRHRLE